MKRKRQIDKLRRLGVQGKERERQRQKRNRGKGREKVLGYRGNGSERLTKRDGFGKGSGGQDRMYRGKGRDRKTERD